MLLINVSFGIAVAGVLSSVATSSRISCRFSHAHVVISLYMDVIIALWLSLRPSLSLVLHALHWAHRLRNCSHAPSFLWMANSFYCLLTFHKTVARKHNIESASNSTDLWVTRYSIQNMQVTASPLCRQIKDTVLILLLQLRCWRVILRLAARCYAKASEVIWRSFPIEDTTRNQSIACRMSWRCRHLFKRERCVVPVYRHHRRAKQQVMHPPITQLHKARTSRLGWPVIISMVNRARMPCNVESTSWLQASISNTANQ